MLHELNAGFVSFDEREHVFRNDFCDHGRGQLRSLRVRRVRLHDHRTTGGQRGCRVATGHRKRERKIARAEHRHRTERTQHRAHVDFSVIDARVNPRPFFDERRKHSKLIARTAKLDPSVAAGRVMSPHLPAE